MTENKRIFVNIIATYGRSLYALICGIFTARWVLLSLGEVDYGLMGVVGGLAAFISFFNGLMSIAVSRFYAVAVGEAQKSGNENNGLEECRIWFNTAFCIHTVLPTILILIGYPIGIWAVRNYLTIPVDRIEACIWVFRFVCITCFVGMVNVPFSAMYTAKQYIAELTIYSVVTTTLNVAFLCYMISHPGEWLVRYSLWTMIIAVVPQIIIAIRAMIVFKECKLIRGYYFQMDRIVKLTGYAFWQFVGMLGVLLRNQGFTVLVNKFFGPAVNASMAIGNNVANNCNTLSAALTGAFSPAAMNAYGRGDDSYSMRLALRSTKFGALLCGIFFVPIVLELDSILQIWLKTPPRYTYEACLFMLGIIMIDQSVRGVNIAIHSAGKVAMYNLIVGSVHILSLPIAWILAREYSIGFVGVLSVLICAKGVGCAIGAIIARNVAAFPLRKLVFNIIIPLCLILAVAIGCGVAIRNIFGGVVLLRMPVVFMVGEALLIGLSWCFLLDCEERSYCINQLKSRILKRGRS